MPGKGKIPREKGFLWGTVTTENILLLSASGQLILTFFEVNDFDNLQGSLSDLDHSDACMPKIDRPLPEPEYP